MKKILLLILITLYFNQNLTAQIAKDYWSGIYKLEAYGKKTDSIHPKQFYTIEKVKLPYNKEDDLVGKSNTFRWVMKNIHNKEDKKILRPFIVTEDKNEYKQFEWEILHKKNKIKCLDGGNLFICKTTPKKLITVGNDTIQTNSGTFGVLLHYGVFELYKQ
ncbi:hypothetical protein [Tenacibaculum jejuense]|uniref:Lipoprotein n=1 Tax=Tenacibaculum jejuense TaxID=584609 RepID=A0A238UE42_9FLAO|nr:hypothetical protein [Tenacibaculum jejuense]SNR17276.1 Protein of unknown function precursor [Tenacibaculum jejuense]